MSLTKTIDTPNRAGLEIRLDEVIDRAIAEKRIVGTVVVVAGNGQRIYERAAGFSNRESNMSMESDAIFRLASVGKPLVTAAAMRLIEEEGISLDDPVTRWLADFRPRLADGSEAVLLVRHLLSHSAGLSYRFLEPEDSAYHRLNISDGLDQPGLSMDENLRRLASVSLVFKPGSAWRYSLATDVLGAAIEQATGESLPNLVRRLVTEPLGMADTGFSITDISRLTTPYADHQPEPVRITDGMAVPLLEGSVRFAPSRILNPASYPSGGAGMAGTASDILMFLEAIRNGGAPLLHPETLRVMTTDQVGAGAETQGPGWGFGFGWAILDDPRIAGTPQSKGTLQWGGAYGHSWFIDPSQQLTVVALTNTAFEGMSGQFPLELRDAVYG